MTGSKRKRPAARAAEPESDEEDEEPSQLPKGKKQKKDASAVSESVQAAADEVDALVTDAEASAAAATSSNRLWAYGGENFYSPSASKICPHRKTTTTCKGTG